jgi:hypothetical protein
MYTINIGLNNNPLTLEEIAKLINQCKVFGLTKYAEKLGEYDGADEPTFVGELDVMTSNFAEAFCEIMTQDCIAFYNHDTEVGELVYNPLYEGDKYEFDPKYFLFL